MRRKFVTEFYAAFRISGPMDDCCNKVRIYKIEAEVFADNASAARELLSRWLPSTLHCDFDSIKLDDMGKCDMLRGGVLFLGLPQIISEREC